MSSEVVEDLPPVLDILNEEEHRLTSNESNINNDTADGALQAIQTQNEPIKSSTSPPRRVENESVGSDKTQPSPPPSPDSNCPICLGKMENKSFTNSCFHQFCFTCLLEWSKVKPQCPLCKQSFKSIVHSVRSMEDYDQYHLSNETLARHQFRTTASRRYRSSRILMGARLSGLTRDYYRQGAASNLDPESRVVNNRFSSSFRRHIYEFNIWVRPASRNEGIRRTDTAFFAANPAMTHRLVPWLNRELNALGCNARVAFVLELVISVLDRFHIQSPEFMDTVRPYVGIFGRHFVHEFYHFARSPFDMIGYDRVAVYPTAINWPFDTLQTNNDDSSSDDSDLEIVDVIDNRVGRPPWSQFQAPAANNLDNSVQEIPQDSSSQLFVNSPYSPQPGPSGLSNNNLVLQSLSSSSDEETPQPVSLNVTVKIEDNRDDDDDIVILNPPPRKSPEVVVLSDDDESRSQPTRSQPIDIDSGSSSVIFSLRSHSSKVLRKVPRIFSSQSEPDSSSSSSSTSTSSTSSQSASRKLKKRKRSSSKSSRDKPSEGEAAEKVRKKHKHHKKCSRHHRRHHKSKSKKSKKDKRSDGS